MFRLRDDEVKMSSSSFELGVKPPEGVKVFAADGTDLTLVRWMLSLTPEERLRVLQNNVNSVLRLRRVQRKY